VPDLARMQERAVAVGDEIGPGRCVVGSLPAGLGGLSAVEVLIDAAAAPGEPVRLTLWAAGGAEPIRSAWAQPGGSGFARFSFEPVADGAPLALCLDAAAPSGARAWHDGAPDQALAARVYRRVEPLTAVEDALAAARRWPVALALGLACLLAPGLALASLAAPGTARRLDVAVAAAPGLGLVALTLAWWLAGLLGAGLTAPGLGLVLAIATAAAVRVALAGGWSGRADAGWLALLWLIASVARLAPVRALALPAWVDGVHHTYLADLLAAGGRVPSDFGPLLPFGPFSYHFGFHALAASLTILSDGGVAAPDAVLVAGQLLGACVAPAAYLLARLYGGSARAGLVAGTVAALVSVLPAYYVSWSRFTQLAGLVALPAFAYLVQRARDRPAIGIAAGAAGAGLLLVHPRVAVMAALLVAAEQIVARRGWRGIVVAAATGLVLAGPWLPRLTGSLVPRLGAAGELAGEANRLDLSAIQTAYDPYLYGAAAAALVGGIVAGRGPAISAGLWLGLALLAANPGWVGLPGSYLISNGALVIALWLPAAALVGHLASSAGGAGARRLAPRWRTGAGRLAAPAILVAGVALARPALEAVNPTTVLATAADRRALEAAARHLPGDAVVAVQVREWQLATYMGADGGYWVGVVTPGRAIVPPLLYGLGPAATARATTERLRAWEAASGRPEELVRRMRATGVEWLFVGERGRPAPAGLTPIVLEGRAGLYRLP
jgi:hypothetical protein